MIEFSFWYHKKSFIEETFWFQPIPDKNLTQKIWIFLKWNIFWFSQDKVLEFPFLCFIDGTSFFPKPPGMKFWITFQNGSLMKLYDPAANEKNHDRKLHFDIIKKVPSMELFYFNPYQIRILLKKFEYFIFERFCLNHLE